MTFNVSGNTLNGILNQRSNDMIVANNWNVFQYSMLLSMMAYVNDLEPGELVHVIADAHIYDRHVPFVKEVINNHIYEAPILKINKKHNFYDYNVDDFEIIDYKFSTLSSRLPVAV